MTGPEMPYMSPRQELTALGISPEDQTRLIEMPAGILKATVMAAFFEDRYMGITVTDAELAVVSTDRNTAHFAREREDYIRDLPHTD